MMRACIPGPGPPLRLLVDCAIADCAIAAVWVQPEHNSMHAALPYAALSVVYAAAIVCLP